VWGIRAARLFDGDDVVDTPTLLIEGERVVAVGVAIPETVEVIDLDGATLLPGLVDYHQHLCFDGEGTLQDQVDRVDDVQLTERARTAATRALAGGVTALRDLGDRGYVTLGLRGDSTLPTVLSAGPPITVVGGHCHYLGGETDRGAVAMRAAVRERHERGCDLVKIMVTGGALTPAVPVWTSQFDLEEIRAAVDESHRLGMPVAAHCHGLEGIGFAAAARVDSIEHCSFLDETMSSTPGPELIEQLAHQGIVVSATLGNLPDRPPLADAWQRAIVAMREAFGRIHRAGGVVVPGTDAGIGPYKPHDELPRAMRDLVSIGMTPRDALRSMTSVPATSAGLADRGILRAGAHADIVAVAGDPLSDASALVDVTNVWRAGSEVPAA
jgi:imidazolonepropionase-like amidohydrolase